MSTSACFCLIYSRASMTVPNESVSFTGFSNLSLSPLIPSLKCSNWFLAFLCRSMENFSIHYWIHMMSPSLRFLVLRLRAPIWFSFGIALMVIWDVLNDLSFSSYYSSPGLSDLNFLSESSTLLSHSQLYDLNWSRNTKTAFLVPWIEPVRRRITFTISLSFAIQS